MPEPVPETDTETEASECRRENVKSFEGFKANKSRSTCLEEVDKNRLDLR